MSEIERRYTMKQAVATFLGPPWTVSSLRTEMRKGHLVVERIAGKLAVTESAIRGMLDKCREDALRPASTSSEDKAERRSGSSEASDLKKAQAAARATLKALKESSRASSASGTSRRKPAATSNVHQLRTS